MLLFIINSNSKEIVFEDKIFENTDCSSLDKKEVFFNIDLNRKNEFQPIHTEICDSLGMAIVAKFKGRIPILGLGKYKSDTIRFKTLQVFPKNRCYKIVEIKPSPIIDVEEYDQAIKKKNQLEVDAHIDIVLVEKSKCNCSSECKNYIDYTFPNGANKFKNRSVIDYHLKIKDSCNSDVTYNFKCGKKEKQSKGALKIQSIGDHICKTILTH